MVTDSRKKRLGASLSADADGMGWKSSSRSFEGTFVFYFLYNSYKVLVPRQHSVSSSPSGRKGRRRHRHRHRVGPPRLPFARMDQVVERSPEPSTAAAAAPGSSAAAEKELGESESDALEDLVNAVANVKEFLTDDDVTFGGDALSELVEARERRHEPAERAALEKALVRARSCSVRPTPRNLRRCRAPHHPPLQKP